MSSEKLNIDNPFMWTPCTESTCVWNVPSGDGTPVSCKGHWSGEHLASCTSKELGWCICACPDSLLGSDPTKHPEVTRFEVARLRIRAIAQWDFDLALCCSAALAGDGEAVDVCVQFLLESPFQ